MTNQILKILPTCVFMGTGTFVLLGITALTDLPARGECQGNVCWGDSEQKAGPPSALKVCHQARGVNTVWVAYAKRNGKDWLAEGWQGVKPGQCRDFSFGSDYEGDFYWYAEDEPGRSKWGGATNFCVKPDGTFRIPNALLPSGYSCTSFGLKTVGMERRQIRRGETVGVSLTN